MFDEKDLILEAKHVTRRFPAAKGKVLVANNDINLKFYKGSRPQKVYPEKPENA